MTDRRHVDPNLMGPPCLKLTCDQTCGPKAFLEPPMGRGVPAFFFPYDRHFLAMARIAAERRHDFSCTPLESAPGDRQIFSLERAGAAMVGKEISQALMRSVSLGDDQKSRRVLVEPMHDSRPFDPPIPDRLAPQ